MFDEILNCDLMIFQMRKLSAIKRKDLLMVEKPGLLIPHCIVTPCFLFLLSMRSCCVCRHDLSLSVGDRLSKR